MIAMNQPSIALPAASDLRPFLDLLALLGDPAPAQATACACSRAAAWTGLSVTH